MTRGVMLSFAVVGCLGLACATAAREPASEVQQLDNAPRRADSRADTRAHTRAPRAATLRAAATAASKPATSAPATTQARATDKNPIPQAQPESPDRPVPLLTPEQAIETFNLPPGFRAEVVAAEPMVQHPVAMTFDQDGRIWVCEMRGYMPDFDGTGEKEPNGRVSILEDTDGDGRMDKRTLFLDNVVLPRAIGLSRDGALIGIPPNLYFCRDTDGDGQADEKTIVATDYGNPQQNPEHQANGLMYGLDNWVHSANYDKRFRNVAGKWVQDVVPEIGQWGITQDDFGRIFTNNNSDSLRANLVPSHYTVRNANYRGSGANVDTNPNEECWPAHPSAVNRGYRDNALRDGRLRKFTATCGPHIYRADLLGPAFYGNAFVAEPSANLIRRAVLSDRGVEIGATNAYAKTEFLASSYERFRPVGFATGPDGALYVVDMHHGILQHKQYLTPYLEHKYDQRLLDRHLLTGRIYRIVPDAAAAPPAPAPPAPARPRLSKANSAELIEALSHANAWWRETAQRLLVERNYSGATGGLKKLATRGENPLGRIHALWTLEGMRRLDPATVQAALQDPHPRVRATAIRVSEFLLNNGRGDEIAADLLKLAGDVDPHVRLQFALTVSEVGGADAQAALAQVLNEASDPYTRDAVISGLRGRELELLERLLRGDATSWNARSPERVETLAALAQAVRAEARPKRIVRLLELMAEQDGALAWRQEAMLRGTAAVKRARTVMLESEPVALARVQQQQAGGSASKALRGLGESLVWPGKPGYVAPPPPVPLTPQQQARFATGKAVFSATCQQCHKADGQGQVGLAPPLIDSEWLLGPPERVVRIVLNGIRGPINVGGTIWNLDMPGLPTLSDEQVAGVLTYARREWDHTASPIDPETVHRIRAELSGRSEAWTEKELLELPIRPERKPAVEPLKRAETAARSAPAASAARAARAATTQPARTTVN